MKKISSLSVQISGQGPPLLLVHGFGISVNIWKNLLPQLSPHFTLVMPELPGIGESDAPPPETDYYRYTAECLRNLRQSLNIDQWNVLGYSSGSRAVEAYLNLDYGSVQRAILLCPARAPILSATGLRFGIWLNARWRQAGDFALTGWRLKLIIQLLAFNLHPNPYTESWTKEIKECDLDILKTTLDDLPGAGAKPFHLPDVPTIWIWGKQDLLCPPPFRRKACDRLVNAGHSAPVTAPDKLAEVILPFLLEPED